MDSFSLTSFIYLAIACFSAAFIDAIAGGGGMISLPAFMGVGIPPHIALGTNKMAASFGAFSSFLKFLKSGKVEVELIKKVFIFPVYFLFFNTGGPSISVCPRDIFFHI